MSLAFLPFGLFYKGLTRIISQMNSSCFTGVMRLFSLAHQHRARLMLLVSLMSLPAILIYFSREQIDVGSFSESQRPRNAVISALLAGERLAPPPSLPPESFVTVEVITLRPSLANASRDWSLLEDGFSQRLLRVFQRMREHGYEMALLEGYRSPERQDQLASMGAHVTSAGAFQSYHQFGLAADSAFIRDGKLVISEKDPWAMRGYELYGQEAEAMGLTWGGRWKMMDFGHVELRAAKNGGAKS